MQCSCIDSVYVENKQHIPIICVHLLFKPTLYILPHQFSYFIGLCLVLAVSVCTCIPLTFMAEPSRFTYCGQVCCPCNVSRSYYIPIQSPSEYYLNENELRMKTKRVYCT